MRRSSTSFFVLLALGLALAPGAARAQMPGRGSAPAPAPTGSATGSTSAPAAAITLPVVKKNDGAIYPKQAIDEGVRDVVRRHRCCSTSTRRGWSRTRWSRRPWATASTRRPSRPRTKLEFEPATRDGKPVAVKGLRFIYTFAPPPPPPSALSGRVVTLAGERPIAGATVDVRDSAGTERTVTTDGDRRLAGRRPRRRHVPRHGPRGGPRAARGRRDACSRRGGDRRRSPRARSEAPTDAGAAPAEDVEEVEVHGEKPPREVTKRTLEQREIDRIPGTNGDALRSLQNLPGVARPPGLAGLLIVRGSAPQDTQYFVDGTPVPIVYHFGGLSSVVPTEMLDQIDFYPGNFSTQYGRAMGGVVDVGLLNPKSDRLHGMARSTSSTRACSRRGRSSTRAGASPSPGGARTSTCGSGPC